MKKSKDPLSKHCSMRRFTLVRIEDESNVSGTGKVAEGIEFSSGKVVMTWLSHHNAVNFYDSIKTVEEIHGHSGKTKIVL